MTEKNFNNLVKNVLEKNSYESGRKLIEQYSAFVRSNYSGFNSELSPAILYQKDSGVLFQLKKDSDIFSFRQIKWNETEEYEEKTDSFTDRLRSLFVKQKEAETFSDMIIRLLREKKRTAPQVYKAAGIDSKHFSKIISRRDYNPTKETVLAFAIAFHLDIKETEDLLAKSGYAFSSSSMFDVTVKFFIENKCYDRATIDALMFDFNLQLLPQKWSF